MLKHRGLRFGSHAQEVEETYPAKFQTKPTLGRYLTAQEEMLGLVKHRELRFGSHAQQVEKTYPAKFQPNLTLGRFATAHTPNQGPGEFPDFGLSWTQQISAREQPLANRCCGIEEEAEDYLSSNISLNG